MKICSPQLGMSLYSNLGGEVHDSNILLGLAKKGDKIFVYLPKGRNYPKHKNIIITFAPIKHIPAFLFNLISLPYIFRTYKAEKFEILRVHSPYFVGIAALIFKIFHGKVKIVASYHLKEDSLFFNMINKIVITKFDAIICVSNYVKDWLVKTYGVKSNKIKVIYNGVSSEFKKYPKNKKLLKKYNLENKIIILFMGLLIERKDPMFLLKVFKQLKFKNKKAALIICGKGPLKNKLKDFVKDNLISDVIFINSVFGKDKVDLFNLCDIFALPSKNEGFGLVVAEAMACAKPVIITKDWSAAEAVSDGHEGYLLKQGDSSDWGEKIEKLAKDKKLREAMGARAQKKAREKYSWIKSASEHERLFKSLIK